MTVVRDVERFIGIRPAVARDVILQLHVGLCVKARRASLAVRLRSVMSGLSNASLIHVLVLFPTINLPERDRILQQRAIPVSVLFVGVSFCAGHVLGGSANEARQVLGFGSAPRIIAAALLAGDQNYQISDVVIVVEVSSLILLAPAAVAFGRRSLPNPKTQL